MRCATSSDGAPATTTTSTTVVSGTRARTNRRRGEGALMETSFELDRQSRGRQRPAVASVQSCWPRERGTSRTDGVRRWTLVPYLRPWHERIVGALDLKK